MEPHESDRMFLSRRRFLGLTAGAVGAVAAACGGGSGNGGGSTAAATGSEPATEAGATTEAAAGTPKAGGTIKIAISDQMSKDSLDPQTNSSTLGLLSSGLIHDTLVQLDNTWAVTPMLAQDWESAPDASSYTFRLRDGVEFHSGKTLDANDVAYTFKRLLDETTESPGLTVFSTVLEPGGIEVVDPTTITFNLQQPDGFFLIKVGFWYGRIIQADADFASGSQGTGPFKSTSFKGGQGFELVKNPNYWMSGLPYLDAINGIAVTDLATKTESVISGDVDFTDPGDFATVAQVDESDSAANLVNEFGFPYVLGIDTTAKPFSDANVRKAMRMLIDRQKYVDVIARGQATVSPDLFVHPKDPFFPEGLEPEPYDPEMAKSLLAEAGYGDGFQEVAWTAEFPGMVDMAVLFKASMAEAGITIDVKNVPIEQWAEKLFTEPIVANYWGRQHPSTMALYMAMTGGKWNEARLSDADVDKWILEAQATTDEAKQVEIYGEIGRRYADLSACIWPFASKNAWPHKKRLEGLTTTPTDFVNFREAYLTA